MKKRVIRSLELDEVSACAVPCVEGASFKIAKSQPVDIREPITGPIVLSGEQRERANAWAAEYLKSMKIQKEQKDMTKPKTTADIVKAYMDRHDVDEAEAFAEVSTRAEYAEAYEQEQQDGHIARMIDERDRTNVS